MAKKRKRSVKQKAQKGLAVATNHGVMSASLLAIGGVISSVLASEKFREGVTDLVTSAMSRASSSLQSIGIGAHDSGHAALGERGEEHDEEHDQGHPEDEELEPLHS